MASIENQRVGAIFIRSLSIPLQKALGAPGYEFKDFKDVDADGKNLKGLKEDLIGRIETEAISILPEIICGGANNSVRP
jgi:hypothetical protein